MVNPDTNKFEELHPCEEALDVEKRIGELRRLLDLHASNLVRPDGSPVPAHWTVFKIDEHVVIKNYTFKVAYIGETSILFEPVGPVVLDDGCTNGPGE